MLVDNCQRFLVCVNSVILHHHHHIALVARISLTLSRHSSISFIALGRSSGQQPVSSHSCWMYVRAGRPAFERPCVGIHKSTSLMSSSLLLQQCPACLVLQFTSQSITTLIYIRSSLQNFYALAKKKSPKQNILVVARNLHFLLNEKKN